MRKTVNLRGILPALVTPMSADASTINEEALSRLTDRLVNAGVGGLVPCGSTGEFTTLTNSERRRVTEVVIDANHGRVPVVPHTGALSTRDAVELSQHAEQAGASAVMVVPPFYEPPRWVELVAHYEAIAGAIHIPIVLYHLPSASGMKMTSQQISELAAIDGVSFLKDSSGDAVALTELVQRYKDRIGVFNGWDSLTFYGFAIGTVASIWGAANFIPELCVQLFDALCEKSDLQAGRRIWDKIWPLCHFLETEGYASSVKAGCDLIGEPAGPPRPPLQLIGGEAKARLGDLLERAGIAVTAVAAGLD